MASQDLMLFDGDIAELGVDARELVGYLETGVRKQFAFALAQGLTWTARDVRDDLRRRLPGFFVVRNKWTAGSIRFKGAKKKDNPPTAIVGSVQPYMALQVKGGYRDALDPSDKVGVPQSARRPATKRTTRAWWPGNILRKLRGRKKGGIFRLRKRSKALFQIKGGKRNPRLELVYTMEDKVKIDPVFPWKRLVEMAVRRTFVPNMKRSLKKSLATAKKRRR